MRFNFFSLEGSVASRINKNKSIYIDKSIKFRPSLKEVFMKPYLIISQFLYILSFVPWFVIWGLSFMTFDSGVNLYNALFVLVITLYPVAVVTGSISAWIFRVKKKRLAIMMNLIPMIWIIAFLSFMFLYN